MSNSRSLSVEDIPEYVELYNNRVCLSQLYRIEDVLSSDDSVVAEGLNGSYTMASFRRVPYPNGPQMIKDHDAEFSDEHESLADVWSEHPEVNPTDSVVKVTINGYGYAFPASKLSFPSLEMVTGIGDNTAENLREAGFENYLDLMTATASDLSSVKGIGEHSAEQIKEDVGHLDTDENADSGGSCPVRDCPVDVTEESIYDHMIDVHGWYMESLEVQKVV